MTQTLETIMPDDAYVDDGIISIERIANGYVPQPVSHVLGAGALVGATQHIDTARVAFRRESTPPIVGYPYLGSDNYLG